MPWPEGLRNWIEDNISGDRGLDYVKKPAVHDDKVDHLLDIDPPDLPGQIVPGIPVLKVSVAKRLTC